MSAADTAADTYRGIRNVTAAEITHHLRTLPKSPHDKSGYRFCQNTGGKTKACGLSDVSINVGQTLGKSLSFAFRRQPAIRGKTVNHFRQGDVQPQQKFRA